MSNLQTILVASATAKTAQNVIKDLSASQKVNVLAFVRKADDPRVAAFANLPNVEIVEGDLDNEETVSQALDRSDRAFLVSPPFAYEMYEREYFFVKSAHERGVPLVRISTSTVLIGPGTLTCYARVHHGIEAYQEKIGAKMVNLRPNLYMDNLIGSAAEAKGAGQISYPAPGDHVRAQIDPLDVGSAAAAILLLPEDKFDEFAEKRLIEVHGPELISFKQMCEAISDSVGYQVKFNPITIDQFSQALQGFGMARLFANSFASTVAEMGGGKPKEQLWGSDEVQQSSSLLAEIGWEPKVTLKDWANSEKVKAAFKKDD